MVNVVGAGRGFEVGGGANQEDFKALETNKSQVEEWLQATAERPYSRRIGLM